MGLWKPKAIKTKVNHMINISLSAMQLVGNLSMSNCKGFTSAATPLHVAPLRHPLRTSTLHSSSGRRMTYMTCQKTCLIQIIWPHIFEWHVKRCRSNNEHQKWHMFERDWTPCSTYPNYSRLNGQHVWRGDLYNHLVSTRTLTLLTNEIFIWDSQIMRQMAMGRIQILESSCSNDVFHILQKCSAKRKVSKYLSTFTTSALIKLFLKTQNLWKLYFLNMKIGFFL